LFEYGEILWILRVQDLGFQAAEMTSAAMQSFSDRVNTLEFLLEISTGSLSFQAADTHW